MSRDRTSWRTRTRLAVGAVVLATLMTGATTGAAVAAQPNTSTGAPVVVTSDGAVRGADVAGTDRFLGLPYAAPPVGASRWRAPQPEARWHGVRDATAFAPHCPQPGGPFGAGSTSEDCLYLNVFAPANHRFDLRGLPVMVWIHGGALVTGESDDFNPAAMVHDGTVVVTINYRLGALGFLAHPALAGRPGGPSGDYGLMDQQAALRWVRANIGRFGGDAHDVTIFGESAGGLSVLSQLASPGARGLFGKAIVESGAYNLTQTSLAAAESSGQSFAAAAGCASQTAACLRALPVSTILADENTSGYTPNIDGLVLTQSLRTSFANGQFAHVPVVNGSNHDEWRLFVALNELRGAPVTAANYLAMISSTLGVPSSVATVIAARYPLRAFPSPALALSSLGTDAIFSCPALTVDQSVSKFVPTYTYEFNDENAPSLLPPVSFPTGSEHAAELRFVFNTATAPTAGGLTADELRLAGTMQRYWTNFATRGVPSSLATPFWPRYVNARPVAQSLVPPRPHVETNFAVDHNCAFWNGLSG